MKNTTTKQEATAQQKDLFIRHVNANNKEVVLSLLNKGYDVINTKIFGRTMLFQAALDGNSDMVDLLLKNGADTDFKFSKIDHGLEISDEQAVCLNMISSYTERGRDIKYLMNTSNGNASNVKPENFINMISKLELTNSEKSDVADYLNESNRFGVTNFRKIVKSGDLGACEKAISLGAKITDRDIEMAKTPEMRNLLSANQMQNNWSNLIQNNRSNPEESKSFEL